MGIIDADLERQGRNGTDAWYRHQTTTHCVVLNHLRQDLVQSLVALEDRPPHIQHGLDHHGKYRIAVLEQLPDPGFVTQLGRPLPSAAVSPERATNVILDVDQLALEQLPVGQNRAHFLHIDILDVDGAVPTQPDHLCNAAGIIAVGFVAHGR